MSKNNNNSRVYYVEPNGDQFDAVKQEDLCISFNLSADVIDRRGTLMTGAQGKFDIVFDPDYKSQRRANFLTGDGKLGNKSRVMDGNGGTFLTTYYISTHSDDLIDRQTSEALGVDSIQISYENFHTPRVQIRFIDVRGAALFGKEESIRDENGELTGENVFGVFFTLPYPRFRLQVKGFYGKPVTFQLACESFKGSFNPSNGNFEADVSFIGYQYSILTDIPIRFITSAPNNPVYGSSYWEDNVNSERWALSDGSKPQKMIDIFRRVESAIRKEEEEKGQLKREESDRINQYNSIIDQITTLEKKYDDIINSITNSVDTFYWHGKSDDDDVLLLTVNSSSKSSDFDVLGGYSELNYKASQNDRRNSTYFESEDGITYKQNFNIPGFDKIIEEYGDLINSIENLKKTSGDNTYLSDLPSLDKTIIKTPVEAVLRVIKLKQQEEYRHTSGSWKSVSNTSYYFAYTSSAMPIDYAPEYNEFLNNLKNGTNVGDKFVNASNALFLGIPGFDDTTLSDLAKEKIKDNLDNGIETSPGNRLLRDVGRYWTGFNFKNLRTKLTEAKNKAIEGRSFLENKPSEREELDALKILGFKPSIGNLFKIIFCHFETFTHIMYSMAEEVNGKYRTDFNLNMTDIKSGSNVVIDAWPSVYNNGTVSEQGGEMETSKLVRSWVGDLNPNPFVDEQQVTLGFIQGIQTIMRDVNTVNNVQTLNGYAANSILASPLDVSLLESGIFPKYNSSTDANAYFSVLCGWLGIRMAQLLGVLESDDVPENVIEALAAIDAVNYYKSLDGTEMLERYILNNFGDGLSENIKNTILLTESDKLAGLAPSNGHVFDLKKIDAHYHANRQPIFVERDGKYVYSYMYQREADKKEGDDTKEDVTFDSIVPYRLKLFSEYYNDTINYSYDSNKKTANFKVKPFTVGKYNNLFNSLYITNTEDILSDTIGDFKSYFNTSLFDVYKDAKIVNAIKETHKKLSSDNKIVIDNYQTPELNGLSEMVNRYYRYVNDTNGKSYTDYFSSNGQSIVRNRKYPQSFKTKEMITQKDMLSRAYVFLFAEYNELYANWQNDSFVKNGALKHGLISKMPYGFLLRYGAALWRQSCENDPINATTNMLCKVGTNEQRKNSIPIMASDNKHLESVKSYFGAGYDELDIIVRNRLIYEFKSFADGVFAGLYKEYGIIPKNNSLYTSAGYDKAILNIINAYRTERLFTTDSDDLIEHYANTFNIDRDKIVLSWDGYTEDSGYSNFNSSYGYSYEKVKNKDNKISDSEYIKKYTKSLYRFNEWIWKFVRFEVDKKEQETITKILDSVYTGEVIVKVGSPHVLKAGRKEDENKKASNEIAIDKEHVNIYLNKFSSILIDINKKVGNNNSPSTENLDNNNGTDETNSRELAIDTYYYLKNVWEKWLSMHLTNEYKRTDYFNVDKFFKENFFFLDKFYNNIYHELPLNMENVLSAVRDAFFERDSSLFAYLSKLISQHNCILFILPDFVNMSPGVSGYKAINDLFQTMPYSGIDAPRTENKFVVAYVDKPAEVANSAGSRKRIDGFDINNTQTLPAPFTANLIEDEASEAELFRDNSKIKAYNVPAFGVSFAKQNQSIFKSINVNMNNPMVTNISAAAAEEIVNMGSPDAGRRLYWQGQDIFSIYSSYSYECEVEMLGNAQIMPLMYFQLNNVPMWRGAYMIFSVNHTITPGNMITKFRGQKISQISTPWCTEYVRVGRDPKAFNSSGGYVSGSLYPTSSEFVPRNSYTPKIKLNSVNIDCNGYYRGDKLTETYKDWLDKNIYKSGCNLYLGSWAISCDIAKIYVALRQTYEAIQPNYSITVSSGIRNNNDGGAYKSNHKPNGGATAIDLQICRKGSGAQHENKLYLEIFRVMDIAIVNHFNDIGQIILESYGNGELTDGSLKYRLPNKAKNDGYRTLHISDRSGRSNPQIFLADSGGSAKTYTIKFKSVDEAKLCAIEFLKIAKREYIAIDNVSKFISIFINFQNFDKEMCDELFEWVDTVNPETGYDTSDDAKAYGVKNTRVFKEIRKYIGLKYDTEGFRSEVRRDTSGYPMISTSETAILVSDGLNTYGLAYNLFKDFKYDSSKLSTMSGYSDWSSKSLGLTEVDSTKEMQPGDFIFYNTGSGSDIWNMYIYLGDDKVAYACSENNKVVVMGFAEVNGYKYKYFKFKDKSPYKGPTLNDVDDNLDKKIKSAWDYLTKREFEITKAGAAALIGNLILESGLVSFRKEGDNKTGCETSKDYTKKIDNGELQLNDFKNGKGYGLAQWTYSARKEGLYKLAKKENKSIGDFNLQLEFIKNEILNGYDYRGVKKVLTSSNYNLKDCVRIVHKDYLRSQATIDGGEAEEKEFQDRLKEATDVYNNNRLA